MKDEQKTIELLKKELEIHNKKVKIIEKMLETSKNDLEMFQVIFRYDITVKRVFLKN